MVAGIPILYGPAGEEHSTYDHEHWPLGTKLVQADGREFRFVENGGVAGVAGNLYQSEVPNANWDELAVAAAVAVGATSFTFTNGSQAISANDFKDGYALIEDDAGEGYLYPLTEHDAVATSGTGTMNLAPGYSIQVALTTNTTVILMKNKWKDVIIHPSPATAELVGVMMKPIAANEYGWVQVHGVCPVLTNGTIVIAQQVMASDAVDGAVEDLTLTDGTPNTIDDLIVGRVMAVSANGEYSPIFLTLE